MINVQRVECSFGDKDVLRGASFELPDGSLAGLIGPSGGGKSVLLKIMGGILRADAGTVHLGAALGEVALMFQEGALFDSLTVLDNVAFPLVHGSVPTGLLPRAVRREVCEQVYRILGRVGLGNAAMKMPGQLSGGMRRRVSLARALVSRPKIVLLDDPTAGLDPVASSVIMNLIVDFHREYRPTMLLVSHDLRRLLPVVGGVLALFNGRIEYNGTVPGLTRVTDRSIRTFVQCRFDLNQAEAIPPGAGHQEHRVQ